MAVKTVRAGKNAVGKQVGERILKLRNEKQLTLGALANGTGLTSSFLSKLERGQTSISVDNLRNLAHFLGVEMVHFFQRDDSANAVLIRSGSGMPLRIGNTQAYGESLITTPHSRLQATLYRTPPGQGRAVGFAHPGEELVHVLKGQLRYWAGSHEYLVKAGDSLWHTSSEPHGWENVGKTVAVTLHVNTPPVW